MEVKKISERQTLRSSLICRICNDVARGMNFDVMTCMSCKAFFRRNALKPPGTLRCTRKFNCEIIKETRSNCPACRLKKCFLFGMKPQLIRSFTQDQLPTPQPLSLLQNDRSTFTCEQWNLLSNIIHAYDEQNIAHGMKCILDEVSSLPVKLRAKPSFFLRCARHCITVFEPLVKRSSDFHSLSTDVRRTLIVRNAIHTTCFTSPLINNECNFLYDPNFATSFNRMCGSDMYNKVISMIEKLDSDRIFNKVMIFVTAFLSNSSIVTLDSSYNTETVSSSIDLLQLQDIYITLLWKYLVDHYGFTEAVRRYSNCIKSMLDVYSILETVNKMAAFEEMTDTTMKQLEGSSVIED